MKRVLLFIVVLCSWVLVGAAEAPSWRYQENPQEYDTLTLESYNVKLAEALQRETDAKNAIASEQAAIESLKQQIADIIQRIAAVYQEKYDILGITEQDVIDAEAEIASIRSELELLLGLMPDELLKRIADINRNEERIATLKSKPVSYLWRIRDQIPPLESLLAQVKANLPDKLSSYTVMLNQGYRDCLYRIAGKEDVYGDVAQWPSLYRANKAQIDQGYQRYTRIVEEPKYTRPQDLIFPGQVLDIPR